jgi:hypothetical protein
MISLKSLIGQSSKATRVMEEADGMVTLKYKAKTAQPIGPDDKNSFIIKMVPGENGVQVTKLSYGDLGNSNQAGVPKGWYLHKTSISKEELQSNWLMEPGTVTIKLAKSFIKPKPAPSTEPTEPITEAKNSGYVLQVRSMQDYKTFKTAIDAGLLDQYAPEIDRSSRSIFFAIPNKMSASASARTFAKRLFGDLKDLELQFSRSYTYNDLAAKSLDAAEPVLPAEI